MQMYKYLASSADGQPVEGMVEALNVTEATAKIRAQYDIVLSVKESGLPKEMPSFLTMEIGGQKLDSKAFTLMCSQFATILSAGIPIARAVKLIADKTTDKVLKRILEKVHEDVEAGRTLSKAFETHGGEILPPTFVETLAAGEESGSMADSFESIYKHFDKQTKMAGKVRSAMAYPVFVMVVAVVVVIVLMIKVVPAFTAVFDSYGAELPLITRMLIWISDFVRNTVVYFVALVALLIVAFIMVKRDPRGAMALAKVELALPIFGNIATLNAASLFANTMATMIGSGLPMTKSVAVTAKVMSNEYIKQQVNGMVSRIEEGHTVMDAMKEADCLPDILIDMVGVGEETGEMKHTLDVISLYYDNELESAISRAVAALEPALLVFIAGVAGFIVIAIYVSMFQMYAIM